MREAGRDLTLMIQADMIAYHDPGEPLQLGLPEMYVSPSCVARMPHTQDDYEQHRYTRSNTTRCQHFRHLRPPTCCWVHSGLSSVYCFASAELRPLSQACCSDHQARLSPSLLPGITTDGLSHLSPSITRGSLQLKYSNVQGRSPILCTITVVRSLVLYSGLFLLKRNLKGDVSDRIGYDFDQLVSIAKVQVRQRSGLVSMRRLINLQFATLLHAAGFEAS
jgi:hypothetical protein